MSVNSLNNVIIKNDRRFYDRKGFWYGFGITPIFKLSSYVFFVEIFQYIKQFKSIVMYTTQLNVDGYFNALFTDLPSDTFPGRNTVK